MYEMLFRDSWLVVSISIFSSPTPQSGLTRERKRERERARAWVSSSWLKEFSMFYEWKKMFCRGGGGGDRELCTGLQSLRISFRNLLIEFRYVPAEFLWNCNWYMKFKNNSLQQKQIYNCVLVNRLFLLLF